MASKLKINVSFPQYDQHIYDFIKNQQNPSAFIRKLVESYMNGTIGSMMMANTKIGVPFVYNPQMMYQQQVQGVQEVSVEEEIEEDIEAGAFSIECEVADNLDKLDELPF